MAVAVYLLQQDHQIESPAHYSSCRLAKEIIAARIAVWLKSGKKLKLVTEESWISIKLRFRPRPVVKSKRWNPINAPGYPTMCLQQYPPQPRSAEEKVNQRRIWMNAEKFLGTDV